MIKTLRYLGDPILRKKNKEVEVFDDEIKQIAQDLIDNMKAHNGIGLAAPQIGLEYRMFASCISGRLDEDGNPYDEEPTVYVNPKITRFSKETVVLGEGCVSIPKFYEDVERPSVIDIEYQDINGKKIVEKGLKYWKSRCFQHEYDHLDGILFIDRLTTELKKQHENTLKILEMQYRKNAACDPFKI